MAPQRSKPLRDWLLPRPAQNPPQGPPTFTQYLRRMPLVPLLVTIALAIGVRLAVASLLLRYEPGLPLVANYLLSVIPALASALGLTRWFWIRSGRSRTRP